MAFPKGERAKGMKGIVHKLEFPHTLTPWDLAGLLLDPPGPGRPTL